MVGRAEAAWDSAFLGNRVLAATARGSILVADVTPPAKNAPQAISGWKINGEENFLPQHTKRFDDDRSLTYVESAHKENPLKMASDALPKTDGEQAHDKYIPFTAIASNDRPENPPPPLVLAGCGEGVFRSQDQGMTFEKVSRDTFRLMKDSVTIPPNWLLVSGRHHIVVEEDTAGEGR